jgi:PAS domain S-box-containing protein
VITLGPTARAIGARITASAPAAVPASSARASKRLWEIDALRGVMVDVTARKAAEEELDARARQQAAVAALGLRALTPSSLHEIFEEACSLVVATLGTECVSILEQSADGAVLHLRAGRGWHDGLVGTYAVPGGKQSMAGYSIAAGTPVVSECLRSEKRFAVQNAIDEHSIVSATCVAIGGASGRAWGVLGAYTRTPRRFNEDDINFLQAMANTIAAAIERRSAEERLRLSGETLRTLIDSSPIGIIVTSIDDVVTLWNPAAEAMFGVRAGDVLGKPFPASLEGDAKEHAILSDAIANDRPITAYRTRRARADGTPIDISLWIVRLRDAAGRPDAVLARDVYVHRLRSGIAAMRAALDGLDALAFTGGVGENAAAIRAMAIDGLGYLGLRIDPRANETGDGDREIGLAGDQASRILVVSSREDLEIARQVRSVIGS